MLKEKVDKLLQAVLDDNPSLFLIDYNITKDNSIGILIDGDNGVTVEDCITVSRAIEHNLDREEEDFSLEVGSIGATAPLTLPRQYVKNIGRVLSVKTETEKIEAELVSADDNEIALKWKAREPKPVGKGKHTVEKEAVIPYEKIVEAKVMIKF